MILSASKIKAEYDRIAPFFAVGSALTFPFRRSLYEQFVLPRSGLSRGNSVLELCCGAGHNFPYLLSAIGAEGRLTGIDFSPKMLEKARERVKRNHWENVELICGDATRLEELVSGRPDLILCSLALSLIAERAAILQGIRNVLKPEGRLVVIEAQRFAGAAAILNPLLYASMLPVPSNNRAIFHEAPRTLERIKQVFPRVAYSEHYCGSVYVVVAGAAGVS
jgi:demethylmenaquinone methyltransferase/2-methoxy-6-polyprenyl-1,4-benzoquinol methylase